MTPTEPEPQKAEEIDDGSGPSSHETCGTFPADEVAATHEEAEATPRDDAEPTPDQ
jgi:hypothetical protein